MTEEFSRRYAAARRQVIAQRYRHLNDRQRDAVLTTEGPLLLLAGAGSGKTTVLINRVDNLLNFGRGSDCGDVPSWAGAEELQFLEHFPAQPSAEDWQRAKRLCAVDPAVPWSVIAITFTNKAAGELKERMGKMCGSAANDIWAATFHSACVRILRRDIERLGFDRSFTIYDTDDSKRLIKEICKDMGLAEKEFPPRSVLSAISSAKDEDCSPEDLAKRAEEVGDWRLARIAKVYAGYARRLKDANALDFDDIILHTVHLLQREPEVRAYYQKKFRYVLVDEYQDTNHLQYLLASLLTGERGNICVVGDDDQSIYRFRGANIENILSFESQYKNARTIRLEQNYRSTQHILDAANGVIRNNTGRKGKTLWTANGAGEAVQLRTVQSENDEAAYVVADIMRQCSKGRTWKDCAILYRMNAQSNALEMALRRNGIPYKVIGGLKFFDRAEVKDMLSYLCVIDNPADDLRLRRIVNTPARGIGGTTVDRVAQLAVDQGMPMLEVMKDAESYDALRSAAKRLTEFAAMIGELGEQADALELPELYDLVCEKSGYTAALERKNDQESRARLENVQELRSSILSFLDSGPEDPSLSGFLADIALYTDIDSTNDRDDAVLMMTMHSAKGLEFPNVYVVGMEEGVFPGIQSIGEMDALEEERRLCYVAMTRAKERLTLLNCRQRMIFGRTNNNQPSRFLEEIPAEERVWEDTSGQSGGYGGSYGGGYRSGAGDASGGPVRRMEFRRPQPRPRPTPDRGSSAPAAAVPAGLMALSKGDSIVHGTFGKGLVLGVRPMGNDALVEVAFEETGTKKLMLRMASPHIRKL